MTNKPRIRPGRGRGRRGNGGSGARRARAGAGPHPASGFTLLELLVIFLILGVIVSYLTVAEDVRQRTNQTRAAVRLDLIRAAQTTFAATDPDGDGRSDYARSLRELADHGLVDPGLARRPEADGYRFEVVGGWDAVGDEFDWFAVAVPVLPESTGCEWLHADRGGEIRVSRLEDCLQPDRLAVARTLLERMDIGGVIEEARARLAGGGIESALLEVLDADGDGACTSEELLGIDPLAAARSVLDRVEPDADRGASIGRDSALRAAASAVIRFAESSLEIGAGGEGPFPDVPCSELASVADAFLASRPAPSRSRGETSGAIPEEALEPLDAGAGVIKVLGKSR